MRFITINLLWYFASSTVIAYSGYPFASSLEDPISQLLPRMSLPDRQTIRTKNPPVTPQKSASNPSSSSRGLPTTKPALERTSSKRKETSSLGGNPSQRARIAEPSSTGTHIVSKSNQKPLGKPPLHPSFKQHPAYAVKMGWLAAKKARTAELRREFNPVLQDTSFLSQQRKPSNDLPEPIQTQTSSHRPSPYRSQVIAPPTGMFINVH